MIQVTANRIKRMLEFANEHWLLTFVVVGILISMLGQQDSFTRAMSSSCLAPDHSDWFPTPGAFIRPFDSFNGYILTTTALSIYAFCKLRGARPNPPALRLHADPLQEAMDGAHRIYIHE